MSVVRKYAAAGPSGKVHGYNMKLDPCDGTSPKLVGFAERTKQGKFDFRPEQGINVSRLYDYSMKELIHTLTSYGSNGLPVHTSQTIAAGHRKKSGNLIEGIIRSEFKVEDDLSKYDFANA